jgi:ASC-1-like (ASCH) protein
MKKLYAIVLVVVVILVLLAAVVAAYRRRARAAEIVGGRGRGPFRLKVSDPEYTDLLDGKKTVEARFDRPPYNTLNANDRIVVVRARPKDDTSEYPGGRYKFGAEVVRVAKYSNIEALLKGEGVAKVYPGKTAAEGAERFGAYIPPGASVSDPVLAIELRASAAPPSSAPPPKKGPKRRMGAGGYDSLDDDTYNMHGTYDSSDDDTYDV